MRISGRLEHIGPGTLLAAAGVPLSAAGLAVAFRGPGSAHWRRLALVHGLLGLAAVAAEPSVRARPVGRHDVAVAFRFGTGIFAAGSLVDALARGSVPRLAADATDLRALSTTIGPVRMCAYLSLVIAPGEELFWRGLLQDRLAQRYGNSAAAVLTSVLYGAAHVATGNSAVTGAAMGMGSSLSLLRARGTSVERLALAHAFWVVPTMLRERARRTSGGHENRAAVAAPFRDLDTEREADMTAVRRGTPTGRRVSRWGRLVQLVNNAVHVALYEKSGGRLGNRMLGNQVGLLTTGRQGEKPYSVPLFTFRDGDDVIVVASYRGSAEHPKWFRNLLMNPDAVVRIGDRVWPVRAAVMDAEERAVWWKHIVRGFQGYAAYQRRTSREIPLVRLTPRSVPPSASRSASRSGAE